ncbi:MAG: protoheme IX farnesyltransferase [Deltaproteobacteria bacterium]|nr:protoheme IX farnesyltransferase [Deltaproteobacteria bacterium]
MKGALCSPPRAPLRGALGLAADLVALTKPRVTSLVLLTAGVGMYLAPATDASPTLPTLLAALFATALAVASANALNCWWERDVDRHMDRTRDRPLPARRLDPQTALAFGLALGVLSVPALWIAANALTAGLGALALVVYVLGYTPLKRRSPWALPIGAVPGALPPLMGWTAVTGQLDLGGLGLFAILFVWQLPHFLAIGLFRKDDYARAGLKILPVVRGEMATRIHIALYVIALLPITLALVPLGIAGVGYLAVAVVLGASFFVWSMTGLRAEVGPRWARGLFFVSLVHLSGLFLALVVFAA